VYVRGGMAAGRCRRHLHRIGPGDGTIFALLSSQLCGVTEDVELSGEGTLEWEARGMGSWGGSKGVGYESTRDARGGFSGEAPSVTVRFCALIIFVLILAKDRPYFFCDLHGRSGAVYSVRKY